LESLSIWKRFVKPVPVVASPLLVMVAERVMAEFTIAAVGVMGPAVRLGATTVTEFEHAFVNVAFVVAGVFDFVHVAVPL
jgi:hypothetical protein